jgi:acyl-CoA thioesterase I
MGKIVLKAIDMAQLLSLVFLMALALVACGPKAPAPVSTNVPVPTTEAATAEPTPIPTVDLPTNIDAVFFGDSYTNTSGELTGGIESYARLLSAENSWRETDKAFGGVGYQFFLEQLPQLRRVGPDVDIVFVLGGNNDIGRVNDPAWRGTVAEFYRQLREMTPNAEIYALSPLWGGLPVNKDMLSVREVIQEAVAATDGACYVDLHDPLTGRSDLLVSDGMHPNAAGQVAIKDAIEANMLPWPFCSTIY